MFNDNLHLCFICCQLTPKGKEIKILNFEKILMSRLFFWGGGLVGSKKSETQVKEREEGGNVVRLNSKLTELVIK